MHNNTYMHMQQEFHRQDGSILCYRHLHLRSRGGHADRMNWSCADTRTRPLAWSSTQTHGRLESQCWGPSVVLDPIMQWQA